MKMKLMAISLALAGLFLTSCQNAAPEVKTNSNAGSMTAAGNKADPQTIEALKELLAKHDKALNDKSLDAVMSTFSTDPTTVVLGSGEGERYVGQDSIKAAYTEIFKDYDPGTLNTNCDWKTGGVDPSGTMAWFAATCKCDDAMKAVKRHYVLNVTATALKQENGWRFVMLHMSNAPGGAPPPPAAAKSETKPAK